MEREALIIRLFGLTDDLPFLMLEAREPFWDPMPGMRKGTEGAALREIMAPRCRIDDTLVEFENGPFRVTPPAW